MKAHGLRLMALCTIPFAGACADEQVGSEARGLELAIAPLQLDGIGEACFDFLVTNEAGGAGDTVWSKGDPGHQPDDPDEILSGDPDAVCSGQYGNGAGGDVTYIGPCDADDQLDEDPEGERWNSVTVWFDGLYDDDGNYIDPDGEDGWQDPCPNGCTLDVLCEENADALVEFNFTVLRDAQQGFFDVAVNFEDIFCSAKYDTCYELDDPETTDVDESEPIELLFGNDTSSTTPVDGIGRDHTGVLALACTGGPDTAAAGINPAVDYDTTLHYSEVNLRCYGPNNTALAVSLPLNVAAGNHDDVKVNWGGAIGEQPLQYATYFGIEQLDCGTTSVHETNEEGDYLYGDAGQYVATWANDVWTLYDGANVIATSEGLETTPPQRFTTATQTVITPFLVDEDLSCNKKYLNIAIDLEDIPDGWSCALTAQATATNGPNGAPLENGMLTAEGSNYPFVNIGIKDMKACQQNPLGGEGGVGIVSASTFVNGATVKPMCYNSDGTVVNKLEKIARDLYANPQSARMIYNKADFGRYEELFAKAINCDGTRSATVRNASEFHVIQLETDRNEGAVIEARGIINQEFKGSAQTLIGQVAKFNAVHVKIDEKGYTTETLAFIDNQDRVIQSQTLEALQNVKAAKFNGAVRKGDYLILGIAGAEALEKLTIEQLATLPEAGYRFGIELKVFE